MKKGTFLTSLILSVFLFTSCSDDDDTPVAVNEEEVITTLTVTLVPEGGGTPVILQTRDLDGDGPNAPVITVDNLSSEVTYNGSIVLLNETVNPPENITTEVEEEADEHQFFFIPTADLNIETTYNDLDEDNYPVGLSFKVEANTVSSGVLRVVLRHEPNKSAEGVSDGDITNENNGESDFDIDFDIEITEVSI